METSACPNVADLENADGHPGDDEHRTPAWDSDALYISKLARQYALALNASSREALPLTRSARIGRFVQRSRQLFRRKIRELVQEHWDLALFDVLFGSLKAFVIYPALYFAGLTWTIPLMEYLPLNTQLWTAGYLFCRRHLLSFAGYFRYGHTLNEMNKLRDEVLRIDPRDARSIHRLSPGHQAGTLRVRRSRLRDRLRKLRGLARERNVVLQAELRNMASDAEFLFQANELRNNAYLYEAVLIQKILGDDPTQLTQRLQPEPPLDEESRTLREHLGESLEPSFARIIEQGNSLTDTVKENLGDKYSATSLSLRWINWSYQRKTYRLLAELEVLHFRLLAEVLDGAEPAASPLVAKIRDQRRQIQGWMNAATQFGERAKEAETKREAHEVIRHAIPEAQSQGLRVRLARFAFWLSPRIAGRP